MPDITMCMSIECPKRLQCYRFIAIPDYIQSYADFLRDEPDRTKCFIRAAKSEKERYKERGNKK